MLARDYPRLGGAGHSASETSGEERSRAKTRRCINRRARSVIARLRESTGRRVVVLVDEYDKPILDALSDLETARANRDFLRGLYGTIKGSQAHVRFSLLTGVSKFSKVNLFSGLNNLLDITIDPVYSSVCGYSEDGPGHGLRRGGARAGPRTRTALVRRVLLAGRRARL